MQTVGKWRRWFVQLRLAGLDDAARSEAPRMLSDAQVGRNISVRWRANPITRRLGAPARWRSVVDLRILRSI